MGSRNRLGDRRAFLNAGADPDHRSLQPAVVEDHALGDERAHDGAVVDFAARKETGASIDGGEWLVEVEPRKGVGEIEVGLIEGPDGADVFEVAIEHMGKQSLASEKSGQDAVSENRWRRIPGAPPRERTDLKT